MNIRDVAKQANVSTATVSRVMSGSDAVKPATTARVRKAIEALNYLPDQSARALSRGRSRLFGLVISHITNPFFPDLVYTFNELSERHAYRAVFRALSRLQWFIHRSGAKTLARYSPPRPHRTYRSEVDFPAPSCLNLLAEATLPEIKLPPIAGTPRKA